MTTLKDLTELVKKDDSIIIQNQERSNAHLESLDKNFSKFFDQQERARLDDLEDRLDRKRDVRASKVASVGAVVAKGGGAGFGAGVGVGASLKALGALLLSPKGMAIAAAALFGKSALRLGKESFSALRNALDDRAKTNRGLLRFEAEELKQYEKARKVQLEADRLKAANLARDTKRQARQLIREANQDARLKDEARLKSAEADAARIKAKALKIEIANSKNTIKALTNIKRLGGTGQIREALEGFRSTIDTSVTRPGSLSTLSTPTIDMVAPTIDTTAPSAYKGVSRAPTVVTTSPTKMVAPDVGSMTSYQQLQGYADADINKAGYRRITNVKTGAASYIPINGGNFVRLDVVLADVKNPAPAPKSPTNNTSGQRGNKSVRVAGAFLSPVEAAIQETAELAAKSRYAAVAKTGGTIAKVMGSVGFNAALFAILPSAAADGTISGQIQSTYNGMISAITSGNGKAKDVLTGQELTADQWKEKLKQQIQYHPHFFQDGEGASMKMIANLPGAEFVDFKSRVRIHNLGVQAANVTPAQMSAAERSQSSLGLEPFIARVNGVTVRTTPDFAGNRRKLAAIEAFREQEEMYSGQFGGNSGLSINPTTIQNNNNSSTNVNPLVLDDTPQVGDTFDGGLTLR